MRKRYCSCLLCWTRQCHCLSCMLGIEIRHISHTASVLANSNYVLDGKFRPGTAMHYDCRTGPSVLSHFKKYPVEMQNLPSFLSFRNEQHKFRVFCATRAVQLEPHQLKDMPEGAIRQCSMILANGQLSLDGTHDASKQNSCIAVLMFLCNHALRHLLPGMVRGFNLLRPWRIASIHLERLPTPNGTSCPVATNWEYFLECC